MKKFNNTVINTDVFSGPKILSPVSKKKPKDGLNSITQHIPNFVGGCRPKKTKFKTTTELLNIPWVKDYIELFKGFYRFSVGDDLLMVEFNKGKNWWVIGTLKYPASIKLPKWEH